MASIRWALLLLLALLATSSAHHADVGNLTQLPVPILCRPDQAEALLQLKKSFSLDESATTLPSWRDGTDCCVWEGVGCDASSGHVTVLDLNGRGLFSYGLDPAVFHLTSLRRLDLSMNNFGACCGGFITDTCNIPAIGFERFTLLTNLNLSNSGLCGKIPIGISKLMNLLSLDLSSSPEYEYFDDNTGSNFLGSSNRLWVSNFDTLLANLSNLRDLYLDGVDLSSSGNKWCMSLATSVPHLQVLSLVECYLSGPIHKSLARLHSLTVINLQWNDITAGPFPEFFMNFLNLTVLQLSGINLEGLSPPRTFESNRLRVLDLSYNPNLSGQLPKLSNASSLEILSLRGTNFSYAKSTSLSSFKLLKELSVDGNLVSMDFLSSLGRLGSLGQLDLGLNKVGQLGSIFSWIGEHKNLRSVVLECDFSMIIPSSVSNLKTLQSLRMYNCNLPRSTLSAIGNLMALQTLEIYSCTTYGSMPSFIANLTNLKNLQIHDVYFSGTIPNAIGQLNKLTLLELLSCNFSGRIPSSFVNLTQLTTLDLVGNSLAGEISSYFLTLPVLRHLDLSWNLLSGSIQEFHKVPSQLEYVDLSHNELSGPFPNGFFQLTSLVYLDIRSNNLVGLVDLTKLLRLRNLDVLHLSNNKLCVMDREGNDPLSTYQSGPTKLGLASCNITRFLRYLTHFKHISYLDLSCNKISGDVPNWVWETWSSLSYLNLSHNMLTGMQLTSDVLPPTINILDLSSNKLQGQVPMPNSSAILLDYSNNRFSSILPNWPLYFRHIETAFLIMSNNSINGHIPTSICNTTLEALDLSHNNFIGPIPSCLIGNSELQVLHLRENHLEGTLSSNITPNGCVLQWIDLHGNKIEGQLPRGLSNCPFLEVLDFGGNRIADTFPSWLRRLPELSVIILRSNRFYGAIGDIVGDTKSKECFPSLQIIDLASNNFSGNLRPEWFKQLKSMMAKLNSTGHPLYDNGSLLSPDSTEITYKGFDRSFKMVLNTLTAIDFSNNKLEGTIPRSIGRLVSLRTLNMSHNAFMGEIPAQFGGMTDLEALDLSCNQLSGEIPEELTDLTFLDVLNLSNNQLVGKIPQAHQFSTFGSSSFEGNAGLCGPPLSKLPCGDSPYTPGVPDVHKSDHHVDVVLFLFVGVGYGVGFAAAILVNWHRIGRWFVATARASRT
ncbi:hypothetical protein ACP70R_002892 [Stipagrostis hirtigluma subsp. patula]